VFWSARWCSGQLAGVLVSSLVFRSAR